jgi:hypothetical protein
MICIDCVKPEPLKKHVAMNGQPHPCRYCGTSGTAVTADSLFGYIYDRVRENVADEDGLSQFEYGMIYEGGADDIAVQGIDVVLSEWFDLGDELYFEELLGSVPTEFKTNARGHETHFYSDGGLLERNFYEDRWAAFIEDIRHAHRFFNPRARGFLDAVFAFLLVEETTLRPECVRTMACGEPLFRARTADGYHQVKALVENLASQFGPTPKDKAGSQRMTPNGISALYCALQRETCLSEIRSITGDHVVSVGLTPTTHLKLLDLTRLERLEPPERTLLDVGYLDNLHLKTFINSLVKKMSRPKGRNDELSYLSTQVVFEYLRLRFGAQVDGLVFPSVQTGEQGTNVVLFPEASVISATPLEMPDEMGAALGDRPGGVFEPGARLAVIAGSARFHKVVATTTHATEFTRINDLFMSEIVRKQLGLPAAKPH